MIFFLLSVLSVSQFAPETHVFDGNASKERIAADIAAIAEAGLDWRAPAVGGVQTGVLVTVSLPEKGSSMFHADVDLSPWKGKILKATIRSKGTDVCAAKEDWLGYKFMFSFRDAKTGCMDWLGAPKEVGSWDWKETCARVDLREKDPCGGTISLGLQDTSGTVSFDLSSLRFEEDKPLFKIDADETKCVYTDRVLKMPRLRGVMSPSGPCTENDLQTLGRWGANLLRYQIVRDWHGRNGNQDRNEYLGWVDSKITHLLDEVLPWANASGVQVLVDLHVPPGGRDASGDMNMFYDRQHADTFLMVWTNIATRCVGRAGICGYDLINEPSQQRRAILGHDFLSLQERAATLIRQIDPDTPIIVESNGWDAPSEFRFMRIFKMKDIIYQAHMYVPMSFTHQGVYATDDKWTRVAYSSEKIGLRTIREALKPVVDFQRRHDAVIYIGEFSAAAWAEGAERYLWDCISIFEEYGWHWSYHAFREWDGWSVEHEGTDAHHLKASVDNPRKRVLLKGLQLNRCNVSESVKINPSGESKW